MCRNCKAACIDSKIIRLIIVVALLAWTASINVKEEL